MKKILSVIGARPQFIKHAPIELASKNRFQMVAVHTGQHYDYKMSQIFFDELNISQPHYNLETGSGGHGEQTGKMMIALEPIVILEKPDFLLVYGDTNSTLAGALVASKLNIPVVHIEAGLRSYNRIMPEEINRIMTDHLSSVLFVPTTTGIDNLANEGIVKNVYLVGDVMYDMIKIAEKHLRLKKDVEDQNPFCFATLHRPYNTDDIQRIRRILGVFERIPIPVNFSLHPRTRKIIATEIDMGSFNNITFLDPLSYFDTISMIFHSNLVITDSGGLQKEAYMLKRKCITIRSETEWTETLNNGWNTLVFDDLERIIEIMDHPPRGYTENLYGNGKAAEDIINILKSN